MRIKWLDSLKAFGIFLVFFGHIKIDERMTYYIYSFHMPLFFFMSGLFFKADHIKNGFKNYIIEKAKSRLIPYLTFGIITYIIWVLPELVKYTGLYQGSQPTPEDFFTLYNFARPLLGMLYGNGQNLTHNYILWFLPCLFVTEILFSFLYHQAKSDYYYIAILLLASSIVGYADSLFMPIRLPFGFDPSFTAVVFYGLGFLSRDYINKYRRMLLFPFVCAIIGAYLGVLNGRVDMNGNHYGNYFLYYLSSFLSIYAYINFFMLLPSYRFLQYIGKNTLVLFLLQPLGFRLANDLFRLIFHARIEPDKFDSLLKGLIFSITAILLLMPFAYLINWKGQFLIGKVSKNKNSNHHHYH